MSSTGKPKRLRAVYYRDQDGSEPVSYFIDALPIKQPVFSTIRSTQRALHDKPAREVLKLGSL